MLATGANDWWARRLVAAWSDIGPSNERLWIGAPWIGASPHGLRIGALAHTSSGFVILEETTPLEIGARMMGGRCEALRNTLSRRGLGWEIAPITLAGATPREATRALAAALERGAGRAPEPSDGLCPVSIDDPWGIAVMTGMQRQHQTVEVDGASEQWAAHKAWFLTLIAPHALCAIVTAEDAQTRRAREAIAREGDRIGHRSKIGPRIRIGEPEALARALRGRDVSALIDITATRGAGTARPILEGIGGALTRWIDVREKKAKTPS